MHVHTVSSERQYRQALREIEHLMGAEAGTPEGERLDRLVSLVESWEAAHLMDQFATQR